MKLSEWSVAEHLSRVSESDGDGLGMSLHVRFQRRLQVSLWMWWWTPLSHKITSFMRLRFVGTGQSSMINVFGSLCAAPSSSSDLTQLSAWVTWSTWLIAAQRSTLSQTSCACSSLGPLSCAIVQRAVNPPPAAFTSFQLLARHCSGLMFYYLYSWIHSPHSWRMNMDILHPRYFLCCASKDRKCTAWLLIGQGDKRRDGVIWQNQT